MTPERRGFPLGVVTREGIQLRGIRDAVSVTIGLLHGALAVLVVKEVAKATSLITVRDVDTGAIMVIVAVVRPIIEVCGPGHIHLAFIRGTGGVAIVVYLQLLGRSNYRSHDGE